MFRRWTISTRRRSIQICHHCTGGDCCCVNCD